MKKKFTFLIAALALLSFLAVPMGMRGQTRDYAVLYSADFTTVETHSYTQNKTFTLSDKSWTASVSQVNGGVFYLGCNSNNASKGILNNNSTFSAVVTALKAADATYNSNYTTAHAYALLFDNAYDDVTKVEFNWAGGNNAFQVYLFGDSGSGYVLLGHTDYATSGASVAGSVVWTGDATDYTKFAIVARPGTTSSTATNKTLRASTFTLYESTSGGTTTTYSVTYDAGDHGSGTMTDSNSPYAANTTVTLISNTFEPESGYQWDSWEVKDDDDNLITVNNGTFTMPSSDVTVTAQWAVVPSAPQYEWVETALADLGASDIFVIVGANSNTYALSSANGTSSAPEAVAVTIVNGKIDTDATPITDALKFNISGDASNGYTFYPNGSTTTYIYCTNTNNGVRVGKPNSNTTEEHAFTVTDGYLTAGFSTHRYIGIYNSTDWRCYTGYSTGNIANQTFKYYKRQLVTNDPSISTANVEIAYDATSGSIGFTINNPVNTASVHASVPGGSWITLGTVGANSVPFTCTANAVTTERSETVTLTYVNGDQTLDTKTVTITQAAAPVIYTTIPALYAAATGTETSVLVTFNNWVVSGVSSNGKNVFVTDNNGNGFVIFDNNGDLGSTYTAGKILSGTAVTCSLKKYNGYAQISVDASNLNINDGGTVTVANVELDDLAGVNTGALLHYNNLTCVLTTNNAGTTTYYNLTDGTTSIQVYNAIYAFGTLVEGKTYNITGVYQQYNSIKEVMPRSAADIEEVVPVVPTISVTPATVNAPFAGADGNLAVTYEHITDIAADVYFCTADGQETTYDWVDADIDPNNDVNYLIDANTGAARTAYLKVYALDDNSEYVYSNLVTINQAKADYATLPFAFDGGRADIQNTCGLTQENIGTDYSNSPKLKFDQGNQNDDNKYSTLVLKFNERPGTLTFDIKGNSFSGGTFKVQTSEDGTTYTDLETYTTLDETQHESFDNLGENVRYIKWIYTQKVNGNVALGNISLTKYVNPALIASITVNPASVDAPATPQPGETWIEGTLDITYANLTISDMQDFDIQYYNATGQEITEPDWIEVLVAEQDPAIGAGYVVSYLVEENSGEARTAYFKVYAMDDETNLVYSNLVTISQEAYVAPFTGATYSLVTNASQIVSGKHYIIVGYKSNTTTYYAMGYDKGNNRNAVEVTVNNNTIQETENVYELVINGPVDGKYTIYDAKKPGYLYAASSGSNYLKTQETNDANGQWTIGIENEVATITAQGSNTHNTMRFNSSNNPPIFSCYASSSTSQADIYLYVKDNDNDYEYYGSEITYTGTTIPTDETITVGAGSVMTVTSTFSNNDPTKLIVKDGGQLKLYDNGAKGSIQATVEKNITGYGDVNTVKTGWNFIASPLTSAYTPNTPMTSNSYDLFRLNPATEKWENYKNTTEHDDFTSLINGKGYLYANSNDVTLSFVGTIKPYTTNGNANQVDLADGWNLVGNPYTFNMYSSASYYIITTSNNENVVTAVTNAGDAIAPCTGIVVKSNGAGSLSFTETAASWSKGNIQMTLAQQAINRGNTATLDNAIVNFYEGGDLEKFYFGNPNANIYIPQNGKEYAIVSAEAQGEMPVNFKAAVDGSYTISVATEGIEANYLHLIDNITGMDVDLLQTPSYTFNARQNDYASRFRLVFSANNAENGNDSFAFISNGQIILTNVDNGATVQVIDALGRMIVSTNANNHVYTDNMAPGVYVLRLVNGNDVKTQKIVVK